MLIAANANVGCVDNVRLIKRMQIQNLWVLLQSGKTPLHLAAENRHAGVVATLLEEGASSEVEDNDKKTPMQLAHANGHKNVMSVLKGEDIFYKVTASL